MHSRVFTYVASISMLFTTFAVQASQPNIVLIMVDDMGYGELGITGQLDRASNGLPHIDTPNIDALAQQGLMLENYYATPKCAPSRGSMMTGFHNGHSSVDRNGGNNGGNSLRDADYTMAQHLSSAGYATGIYGKWGLGGYNHNQTGGGVGNINTAAVTHANSTPVAKGFDEFYGYMNQVHAHDYYVDFLWEHDTDNSGDPGGVQIDPVSSSDYTHDLIADKSLQFVTNHADSSGQNPFFLYLPYTIPHSDFNPPNDAIRQAYINAGYSSRQADYAAMMKRMDNSVGDLVDRLKDPDGDGQQDDSVYDDTIILYFSDNGGTSENSLFNGGAGLRGNKGSVYEGGMKSPFIAHWNGTIVPGQVDSNRIAGLDDMFATLSDLAGVDAPIGLDGVSIAGLFTGSEAEKRSFHIFEGDGSSWAIRMGDWKVVNGSALYHLPTDPDENNNVAGSNQAIFNLLDQIARDEGVLSDAGNGAAQTTHIVQYKSWAPQGGSSDWSDNNNWSGGTEFNTRGNAANGFSTPPADNWIATIDNQTGSPQQIDVDIPTEVMALDVVGTNSDVQVVIAKDASLMARNGMRIRSGATVLVDGGTLQTVREIHVQQGGTLAGAGEINTSYDTSGTPFTLKADVRNDGVLRIDQPSEPSTLVLGEVISNGSFEQGTQQDSDSDYSFNELDDWTTDGDPSLDATKPNNATDGTYRGLMGLRPSGLHNLVQATGHTISLGDEMTFQFQHRGFSGWDVGDSVVATLFYLDDSQQRQTLEQVTVLADSSWSLFTTSFDAVSDSQAAGRELWISFDPMNSNGTVSSNEYASIDEVSLQLVTLGDELPTVLTIDGDYTQSTTGDLLVGLRGAGGKAGIDFDQLSVNGVANLAGEIQVELESGYVPGIGDQFEVLTANQIDGTFDAESLPQLPGGLQMVLAYSPTSVMLTVGGLLGDYNYDGSVDAADYTVWRDALSGGINLAADGNQDGLINSADYQVWLDNYGASLASASSATSVPEPSTAILLLTMIALAGLKSGSTCS